MAYSDVSTRAASVAGPATLATRRALSNDKVPSATASAITGSSLMALPTVANARARPGLSWQCQVAKRSTV